MMIHFVQSIEKRQDELIVALVEHISISLISLLIAVIIALPLGIFLTRHEKFAGPVIGITSVLQTIPSLALLGLMIPLVGIGKIPAVIALVIYALLPIVHNTYTGIKEINTSLIEAATAMGMNSRKRLLKVELPLAMPVIMAGIRTAMVLIIGTATLAAFIGGGGLGDLILLGIDRNNTSLILLGAIPAALLAILFDFLLKKMEKLSMKRIIQIVGSFFVLVGLIGMISFLNNKNDDTLVIAGKLGAEPEILINMYKILIEDETDLQVRLEPGFGKTSFVFSALKSGEIDLYPEFSGTIITEFLKESAVSTDRREVYEQAKEGILEQFDMVLLKPMQYNNTYALAVPKDFANKHQIEMISDLKRVENEIQAGFTLEFNDREDGYKGIQELYGLSFPNVKTMEPNLRYQAIETGDINLVDAYSTDSELAQYHLKVLEDDLGLFPPYQGAPLMLSQTAEKYPEVVDALNKLAGKITDEEMRNMNYMVNVEGKSAYDVAKTYLMDQGIID
jgi:osmoprotectant transport system permease protein